MATSNLKAPALVVLALAGIGACAPDAPNSPTLALAPHCSIGDPLAKGVFVCSLE